MYVERPYIEHLGLGEFPLPAVNGRDEICPDLGFGFFLASTVPRKKKRPIRGKHISRERLRKTNSWEMKILAFYMFGSKSNFC